MIFQRKVSGLIDRIIWWEKHRFVYNAVMLATGFISFFIGFFTIPLIYILIGLTLNIIFTFSWILELLLSRWLITTELISNYTKIFAGIYYSFSILGVLLFSEYPDLLMWTIDLYVFK